MSSLTVYSDTDHKHILLNTNEPRMIAVELHEVGVKFEQWRADAPVNAKSSHAEILQAYDSEMKKIIAAAGYQSWDVIAMNPDHPDKVAFRKKFLSEHTHSEDEVRFFVEGKGLFTLHVDGKVYNVLCEKGDLISVPAKTKHWFDMGDAPHFVAIRLFNNADGWIANYTEDTIADRYPRLD